MECKCTHFCNYSGTLKKIKICKIFQLSLRHALVGNYPSNAGRIFIEYLLPNRYLLLIGKTYRVWKTQQVNVVRPQQHKR